MLRGGVNAGSGVWSAACREQLRVRAGKHWCGDTYKLKLQGQRGG
eukprot:CAMPEP_0174946876 /NCGR_PEP_ID=MMETSP1355-20121228/85250_1 /TAXON_ID=464990 /ORGANISM="Hemiselmis tepida, Strain CCMP443" /LENGTH=44 /DNA_ID= /DNA_START= /DNA_END= /DNA_ORIENTATION=